MPRERLLQTLALDELHHEVRITTRLPEAVDLDEVRVLQSREDRGFFSQSSTKLVSSARSGRSS